MGVINLVEYAPTVHSYTKERDGGDQGVGDGPNSHDENSSTYFGYSGNKNDGGISVLVVSEHTFPTAYDLTSVKYRMYCATSASGDYTRNGSWVMYVEYYDGSWHDVPGSRYTGSHGDGSSSYDTGYVTYSASTLTNVTKIRSYTYGTAVATGGGGNCSATCYIYEVEGDGEQYEDIGVRVGSGSTISIAGEAYLTNHKLRFRKGSTTYGIPLVDTGHADASPIRIYDGSAVKALLKYV